MSPRFLTLALLIAAANVSAQLWTYSGSLSDGDKPANGRFDLRVSLLDATRSNPIGSPITFYFVDVHDGAFTVDVDFGSNLSNAPPMRLKTEVSKNNAPFVARRSGICFSPMASSRRCWIRWRGDLERLVADILAAQSHAPANVARRSRFAARQAPVRAKAVKNCFGSSSVDPRVILKPCRAQHPNRSSSRRIRENFAIIDSAHK